MEQVLVNSIVAASVYALLSLGFGLIFSTARFFHFAHGAVYAWAAYVAFTVSALWGWPLAIGIICGIVAAAALGSACELVVYRTMRRRGASTLTLLLSGLGLYMVMQNGLSLVFGDGNKALRTWPAGEGFALAGARVTGVQIAIVIAASLLLIAVWLLLHRTGVGLRFRAVSNDQDLASAVGTHVDRSILLAFALGSALAGGAAILISLDVDMTPNMGFIGLMMAVAASIVGGIGSIPGAALGALIVAFAQQLSAWWLPSQWQDPIAFGILFVFLIIRPQGVFGQRIKKASI